MRVDAFRRAVVIGLAAAVTTVLLASCAGRVPISSAAPPAPAPGDAVPAPTTAPTTVTAAPPAPAPVDPAPTTAPTPVTAAPPPDVADEVLRRGDTGPEVLALQRRLTALGYWLGEPDGRFGWLTEQAVYAVQGVAGLVRDGHVGERTRAALDAGTRQQARSSRGTVTEIDREAGVIAFVRDGVVELVVHTSTGTFEEYRHEGRRLLADTPGGRFTVAWAFDGWRDGELGRLYRPRYFHPDGIAVHGYPVVPAYPASHGCARVSIPAMDMIWSRGLMPRGSEVWVF